MLGDLIVVEIIVTRSFKFIHFKDEGEGRSTIPVVRSLVIEKSLIFSVKTLNQRLGILPQSPQSLLSFFECV